MKPHWVTRPDGRFVRRATAALLAGALATLASAEPFPPPSAPRLSSHTHRAWTVDDGVPPGAVYDLAQSDDGYLWLATYGGLVRFDGLRFTVIDATTIPSLASNQASALCPASDGGLWVAPVGANVFRTDGRREVQVLPPRPNAREFVRRLAMAPDGALWTISDTAVERFSQGRWTEFRVSPESPRSLRTLWIDRGGTVWLGASDGVFRIEGERVTRFALSGKLLDGDTQAIYEDRAGRMWFGGSHGLDVLASRVLAPTLHRVDSVAGHVVAVTQDADGTLWVSTSEGVHLLATDMGGPLGTRIGFVPNSDFGGSVVAQLLAARTGAVVAVTGGSGFHVFTPRVFTLHGLSPSSPGRRVHHLAPDGAEGMWAASACDGLTHVTLGDRPDFQAFLPPALGLQSPCVRGLLRDRQGHLWIGQAGGTLTRLSADGGLRRWTEADGLPNAELGPLLEDRAGTVWVGSRRGALCLIQRDERVVCPQWLGDDHEKIWSIAEDRDGSIWVGQVGRLTRRSTAGDVRSWTAADGLPTAPIRVLVPRDDGSVWLATYGGGLARVKAGRISRVGTAQGLFDNALSALLEDPNGAVWLLGNRGVFVTRWADLVAAADGDVSVIDGTVYGPADGVPEGNGGHPASAVLSSGQVGFATVSGLAVIDPARRRPATPPVVVLEDVHGAESAASTPGRFTIPPGGGPVEIRFAAPAIGGPGSVRVRFRLRQLDRDWVEAGLERRAVYSGLAPGEYSFDVSARHADGPWSAPVTAANLVMLPLWWQTWTARAFAVATLALCIIGLVQLRLRTVERRNRALSREIQDRMKAEEAAHRHLLALARVGRLATAGELAASLAHELGQPLTAIVANAQAVKMLLTSPTREPARVTEIVESIATQGRRAADVIRGLRTFLKRGEPEFAAVDVNVAVREVIGLLESSLLSARTRLDLDLASDLTAVRADRVPLQQVVLNLVLNAVDAMREREPDRRCVLVRTRQRAGVVRVSVVDSGPGLPRERYQQMFEPFYTTKAGGMGMGLAISRSIVEAHGGRIHARGRRGGGSVFSFFLPSPGRPGEAS